MNDFRTYSAAFHAQNDDVLHYGILGMKWGVRRYQNKDGSLTSAGKKRYSDDELNEIKKASQRGGIIGGLIAKRKIDIRKKEAAKNGSNNHENTDKKDTEEFSNKKQSSKKLSKDLQQIRDSFKSNEARNKWQKAADTDVYDLDFLEYTQNDYDEMSEEQARKARLKDYAKYCKDRKNFMTRWS